MLDTAAASSSLTASTRLAIGHGVWAARLGAPFGALEVEVQANHDARGELGVEPQIHTADRFSSWRDDLARPVPVQREVRFAPALR